VSAAPGSSAIASVEVARGYAPPKIRAHVSGGGATRHLAYSLTTHAGLSVSFAERAHREYHVLGAARGSHGTLRFVPGAGSAGRRTIYAIVSENGVPRQTLAVSSYKAPGPGAPGRARGLGVRRHGRRFLVGFSAGTGAAYSLVQVTGSDGRRLVEVVRGHRHTLSLPVLGYSDHLRVTVTGVSPLGRRGRSVSARV
jgi:hypothetical protein